MRFDALSPFARYGFLGVHLFFMISGFVVSMSAEGRSAREFFTSRVVRLYPAYWAAGLLTVAAVTLLGADHLKPTFDQWLVNLTMMQQFFDVRDLEGVYWSLTPSSIKFYLLVFLL